MVQKWWPLSVFGLHLVVLGRTLSQPLRAPTVLPLCPDVTVLPTHRPLLCISHAPFIPCLSCPPTAFVDSNLNWPCGGPCRAPAKTGRGNRRVSAEEVAYHHVIAKWETLEVDFKFFAEDNNGSHIHVQTFIYQQDPAAPPSGCLTVSERGHLFVWSMVKPQQTRKNPAIASRCNYDAQNRLVIKATAPLFNYTC